MVMMTKNMGKNRNKCKDKSNTNDEDCLAEAKLLETDEENPLKKVKTKKEKLKPNNMVSEIPTNFEDDIVLGERERKKRKHQTENTEKLQQSIEDSCSKSKKKKAKDRDSNKDISVVVIEGKKTDALAKNKRSKNTTEVESLEKDEEEVCEEISIQRIPTKKRKKEKTDSNQVIDSNSKKLNYVAKEKKIKIEKSEKATAEESLEDKEIDEFCNELDEKANEKYEDWIKQLENVLKK